MKADARRQGSVGRAGVLHEAANHAKTLPYMPLPTQPVPTNPFKYDDMQARCWTASFAKWTVGLQPPLRSIGVFTLSQRA